MKLDSIKIKNFKGISNLTVKFTDITNISGTNGIGKSSIYDAYLWCLTGKDSSGDSEFKITPQDEYGRNIDYLENDVIVNIINIHGTMPFRRVRVEDRTKKDKKLKGYKTEYYVDDVPHKKHEYERELNKLIDVEHFRILSNPYYFARQEWKQQREQLISISNIKTDLEIAREIQEIDTEYKTIVDIYENGRDVNKRKIQLEQQIKDLDKSIKDIPTRIDENESMKPDPVNEVEIKSEIDKLQKENDEIDKKDKYLLDEFNKKNEVNIKIQDKITQLNTKRFEVKNNLQEKHNKLSVDNDLNELKKERLELESKILKRRKSLKDNRELYQELQDKIYKLGEEWGNIKKETFTADGTKTICPTCKREYENAGSILEELEEEFNLSKAQRIKNNEDVGSGLLAQSKNTETIINDSMKDISGYENQLNKVEQSIISHVPKEKITFEDMCKSDKDMIDISEQIDELKKSLTEVKKEVLPESEEIKKANTAKISDLNKQLGAIPQIEKYDSKIKQLRTELKESGIKSIQLQGELDLIVSFNKKKMKIVEESVNKKFSIVKFRLWENHINGNDKETCVILINGVPFSDASTAQKTQIGLDIINTFSNIWEEKCPIFIDNRESVIDIPELDNQIINLIVDKRYKELTIS